MLQFLQSVYFINFIYDQKKKLLDATSRYKI